MPTVEIAAVVVALAGAWMLTRRRRRGWTPGWLAAAGVVLAAQLLWVGPHWQFVPGYLALLLLAVLLRKTRSQSWLAAGSAAALSLGVLALLWALPLFSLPKPTGPYAVGTRTVHWTDAATRRELVVQLWYPAEPDGRRARYARTKELKPIFSYQARIRTDAFQDAPARAEGGPFPVLLFGHMWGGRRNQDTFVAEELASHGYAVVAPDHPLNAARVELADGRVLKSDRAGALSNVEATGTQGVLALWAAELALWTQDNRFVLDRLEQENGPAGGWLRGHLDFTRVGAFGHSFGGAASMALLGVDARVRCAANLDGWTFSGMAHRTSEPVLFVYAAVPPGTPPQTGVEAELDAADNGPINASLARYGGARVYVTGTQHQDFTDQTLLSPLRRYTFTGPIAGDRVRRITRELLLTFFDRNLKGSGAAYPEFPEVKPGAP